MKPVTLERWVWVLIYLGAVVAMHGLWLIDGDAGMGWTMFGIGTVMAALGVAGIVWRARMDRAAETKAAR
jgi:hypothetical protein